MRARVIIIHLCMSFTFEYLFFVQYKLKLQCMRPQSAHTVNAIRMIFMQRIRCLMPTHMFRIYTQYMRRHTHTFAIARCGQQHTYLC